LRRHATLETGRGLPGRVWLSRTPAWVPDLAGDPECVEEAAVAQAGLRTAFVFPIRLDSAVAGVFVFFGRESRPRDDALLEMAEEIGGQIGQFAARELAQKALSEREEQLRQSQKMEAVGTLAGGIAHDFNNLMTVVSGRAQILMSHARGDDRMRRDLELIHQTAARAARLVKQLLIFSRRQVLEPRVLDLNSVVAGIKPMLERLIREDIDLVAVLGPGLWRVKVDPGQIEQVIVNLAVNARDAMPGGGRLTMETANVEPDEETRRLAGVEPGEYVMFAVSDTGYGMDAETRARIFEPFFTTKGPGEGTGLGLSTVYGIVKQSGGGIAVESEPGRGTTFRIYLPRVDAPLERLESAPPAADETLGGTETILLVEDDADIRALIREVLQSHGYTVLEASDVNDAMAIGGRHPAPIDLLLTDVVMPNSSGPELAQRLVSARPDMQVLYMSGYTGAAVHRVRKLGPNFLEKPFTPDALALAVRKTLDLSQGSS
jgi:signal transduction histidine kinase/ActR/RegA family two-component response regulator